MTDVFISYARTERAKAERIRDLLEGAGLSTFFDVQGLDGGDVFPDVLDREVKSAGCVLGLWSPYALSRPWIRTECLIGKDRGVLVPAAIEPIDSMRDIPAAFYGVQHIDLANFSGDPASEEWRRLMRAVARALRRPDLAPPAPRSPTNTAFVASASRSRGRGGGWIVPAVFALAMALAGGAGLVWAVDPFGWKKPAVTAELPTQGTLADATGVSPPEKVGADNTACPPVVATVYFEWQSVNITGASRDTLMQAVQTATSDCIVERVTATGFEDMTATPDLAMAISRRRAENVVRVLEGTGLASSIFRLEAKGNTDLPVPTDPGVKEPLNRRVTVEFSRWPGQETESFDSQTFRLALVEALPRLMGGKKRSDPDLDRRALVAGLREVAGFEYVEMLARERGEFAVVAGWANAEGLTGSVDLPAAARYFSFACDSEEPAGCIGLRELAVSNPTAIDSAAAKQVLTKACNAGVSEACATR